MKLISKFLILALFSGCIASEERNGQLTNNEHIGKIIDNVIQSQNRFINDYEISTCAPGVFSSLVEIPQKNKDNNYTIYSMKHEKINKVTYTYNLVIEYIDSQYAIDVMVQSGSCLTYELHKVVR